MSLCLCTPAFAVPNSGALGAFVAVKGDVVGVFVAAGAGSLFVTDWRRGGWVISKPFPVVAGAYMTCHAASVRSMRGIHIYTFFRQSKLCTYRCGKHTEASPV